jgi:hypothetical protein
MKHVAVLGPGRIGRQIALAFALGGSRVSLVDVKTRPAGGAAAVFADARREVRRDLTLMAEEGVIQRAEIEPALGRIDDRTGLEGLEGCGFVQEALLSWSTSSATFSGECRRPSRPRRSSPRPAPRSRPSTWPTRSAAPSASSSSTG